MDEWISVRVIERDEIESVMNVVHVDIAQFAGFDSWRFFEERLEVEYAIFRSEVRTRIPPILSPLNYQPKSS